MSTRIVSFIRAKFGKSAARERDLERRYRYIRGTLDVAGARAELGKIENAGLRNLLGQLDDLDVIIGADSVLSPVLAMAQPRLAMTIVIPKRRPLIWLNLVKHCGRPAALVDTLAHEAIHTTVLMLGRLPRTPQPEEEIAYHAEEIVALTGANHILTEIKFPAKQQVVQNLAAIENHKTLLTQLGCSEEFLRSKADEGAAAKAFLMDHLIKMPTSTDLSF